MKRLVVLILAFASLAFRAPTAYGSFLGFQNLVVFGDSLSDNGNTFSSVELPKAPYYDGRMDEWSELGGLHFSNCRDPGRERFLSGIEGQILRLVAQRHCI